MLLTQTIRKSHHLAICLYWCLALAWSSSARALSVTLKDSPDEVRSFDAEPAKTWYTSNGLNLTSTSSWNEIKPLKFTRDGYSFDCGYDKDKRVRPDHHDLSSAIRWFIDDHISLFDQNAPIGPNAYELPLGSFTYYLGWYQTLTWGQTAEILRTLSDEAASRKLHGLIYASVSSITAGSQQTLYFAIRHEPSRNVDVKVSGTSGDLCFWEGQIYPDTHLQPREARGAIQQCLTYTTHGGTDLIPSGERKFFLNGVTRLEYRVEKMGDSPTFDFSYSDLRSLLNALTEHMKRKEHDKWTELYGLITREHAVAGYLTLSRNNIVPNNPNLVGLPPSNSTDPQSVFRAEKPSLSER